MPRISRPSLLSLVLAALACSEAPATAPVTPPVAPLPDDVRLELVQALTQVSSVNLSMLLFPESTEVGSAMEFFTDTLACPVDGDVIVSGMMRFDDPDGVVTFDFRDDFRGCAAPAPTGRTWIFTAEEPMRSFLQLLPVKGEGETWLIGSITGRLRFEADSLSGACGFSLAVLGRDDTVDVAGTVCGSAVQSAGNNPSTLKYRSPVS